MREPEGPGGEGALVAVGNSLAPALVGASRAGAIVAPGLDGEVPEVAHVCRDS